MRNIFDQYSQPENRITHALMTVLNEDRCLLDSFLRDLVGADTPCPPAELKVLEQRYPGEEVEHNEAESERRGIPDAWITSDVDGWCVIVESKVLLPLSNEQLERHRRTASRRGFQQIFLVAITPRVEPRLLPYVKAIQWQHIYIWLRQKSPGSNWAAHAASYLEVAEAQLVDRKQLVEGTLTMFAGIPFNRDYPFTYLEGKRVLALAMQELRDRSDLVKQLGVIPGGSGRGAIKGSQSDWVWDFLPLEAPSDDRFTRDPHLNLGIGRNEVHALLIIPNNINGDARRNIIEIGSSGFRSLVCEVVANLKPLLARHPGAAPLFCGLQRRWTSRSSQPLVDADIRFDLRTALFAPDGPKIQSLWIEAAYEAFANKNGSNYEMAVGVSFPYSRCPELNNRDVLDMIAAAWLGCRPLVSLIRQEVTARHRIAPMTTEPA